MRRLREKKSKSSKLPCRRGCGRGFKNAGARTKHEAACAHGRDAAEEPADEGANDDLIGQKVINVFPGEGDFMVGFVRERIDSTRGTVLATTQVDARRKFDTYACVWHGHDPTEHQGSKIRKKLLREWAWDEVPVSDIDPAFRALYRCPTSTRRSARSTSSTSTGTVTQTILACRQQVSNISPLTHATATSVSSTPSNFGYTRL